MARKHMATHCIKLYKGLPKYMKLNTECLVRMFGQNVWSLHHPLPKFTQAHGHQRLRILKKAHNNFDNGDPSLALHCVLVF